MNSGHKTGNSASELGVSQQTVSRMEQSDILEDDILDKIAKILGVTLDAIKNFSDEAVVNYFNTFNDGNVNHHSAIITVHSIH